MKTIYLDHAASSWPKPPSVSEKMKENIDQYAANPGRGNHSLARLAGKKIVETRENLSKLTLARPS